MSEFEPGTPVLVKYPRSRAEERGDRAAWPWMPGTIEEVCGPDEWSVVVDFAMLENGTPAPADAPDDELFFPVCFRDSSEIRAAE